MKKILVIENDFEDSKLIESSLPPDELEAFFSHNKEEGLEIAFRYHPDVILLDFTDDISDGAIISKIRSEQSLQVIPLIVISKNYSFDQQRVVMERGADDYIPVPYIEKSLLNAINQSLKKVAELRANLNRSINTFDEFDEPSKGNDHILVKVGSKLKLVKFADIICITAQKEYSKIYLKDRSKVTFRKSMRNWVKILPSKNFLRIHRATIINIECIDKIVKTNERTYTAHLKDFEETFQFSYRYANLMRQMFPS